VLTRYLRALVGREGIELRRIAQAQLTLSR
jgi:hypothetical protein